MAKINTIYVSLFCGLMASCGQAESNSDIVSSNLESTTDLIVEDTGSLKLIDCFHKEQRNSMELDGPYFSQCLSSSAEQEVVNEFKNKMIAPLLANRWSLYETIEDTEIYTKHHLSDGCLLFLHVTVEPSEYVKDYFAQADSRPLYNGTDPTLIITRFTEPSCK